MGMASPRAGSFIDPTSDPRPDPPGVGDERTLLLGFLTWMRATLELKCAGLTAEQLARRSVPPSTMSLLGLVRHLADVERGWFRRYMAGQDARPRFSSRTDPDGDFDGAVADDAVVEEAWAAWREEVAFADRFVAEAPDLEVLGARADPDNPRSLRWVLIHMIEEYGRHLGHVDLLRERIDGRVGE